MYELGDVFKKINQVTYELDESNKVIDIKNTIS